MVAGLLICGVRLLDLELGFGQIEARFFELSLEIVVQRGLRANELRD